LSKIEIFGSIKDIFAFYQGMKYLPSKLHHYVVLKAGNGGKGLISFTKNTRSGIKRPDGGDGGDGGDIIIRKSPNIHRLQNIPSIILGSNGFQGKKNGKKGARGDDKTVSIPLNVITDPDIFKEKPIFVVRGGKGLHGNHSMAFSSQQRGVEIGENLNLYLSFKEFDFALIGPPNSGKTTLINKLCGTKYETSFFPGNSSSINVGSLNSKNSVCGYFYNVTVVDIPGIVDLADFIAYHKILSMSRNIIILSEDANLLEHLNLMSKLEIFDKNLMPKVNSFVLSKADKIIIPAESSYLSKPVIYLSSLGGAGIQNLREIMISSIKKESL
jgi:GTPase